MGNLLDDKELLLVIKEMFLGYQERKKNNMLYNSDQDIPKTLIKLYYGLDNNSRDLNDLQSNFIQHYIECECELEGAHSPQEKEGIKEMYNFIHSEKIDNCFNIWQLLSLHRKLYSKVEHLEFGGSFRNSAAYSKDCSVEYANPEMISALMVEADKDLDYIMKLGEKVNEDKKYIFEYIKKCIELNCKLLKIHPFADGNGRSVRCFINKLFLNVGLPSVYITKKEKEEYIQALSKASGEEKNLNSIIQFYYYKICDSIFELDIYPKLNKETFDLPKNIIKLAKECTERLSFSNVNLNDNKKICDKVEEELNKIGINNDRVNTNNFSQYAFLHDFILVYYNTVDDKRFIIDPMFAGLEKIGVIDEGAITPDLANIVSSLRTSGVASVSNEELGKYIELFENYGLEKPKKLILK